MASPLLFLGRAQALFPSVPALREPHFPSRLHQFVWRNWELANLDRMAEVAGTQPDRLREIGDSMGLPPKRHLSPDQLRRGYITLIRQNWHLLPEEQIIQLLGWDRSRYDFTLKEDDALDIKLGRLKPDCPTLRYTQSTPDELRRAKEIRESLHRWFGQRLNEPGEDRFAFVKELSEPDHSLVLNPAYRGTDREVNLSPGWSFELETRSEVLEGAVLRFRDFMQRRLNVSLQAGANKISLELQPGAFPEQESFRITTDSTAIRIVAATERGALRALYHMQAEMERREAPLLSKGEYTGREVLSPRYDYSYFALYGDPLMEGDAAGLPDAYLERAAASGVNGVWIQAVLNTLAPSKSFPEFGAGSETRLRNLRSLAARARKFGVRIFLYLNEPRAMPASFFRNRPEIQGTRLYDLYAMCTSTALVRDWIRDSVSHVFREVPDLGGFFSVTMSENHTNCFSHGGAWGDKNPDAADCPRCSKRTGAEVIAELIQTFHEGVRAESKSAEVITWDWGWGTPLAEAAIPLLPKDSSFLSISEWSQPVDRGGVKTQVGEYSMSVPGPGPRARHNWEIASQAGLRTLAKTQFNNTWEISAVPYIPVMPLVLDHCEKLAQAGISGVMESWTCGGYPSPNLRAAAAYSFEPRPSKDQILTAEAERLFGKAGAPEAVMAWRKFSSAFAEFPYGVAIYVIPTQHGPANLLRLEPTGLKPSMMLFPYDGYQSWKGPYTPEAMQSQFEKLASKWRTGLADLENAAAKAPKTKQRLAHRELAIARTCFNNFQSVSNQIAFYILRDAGDAEKRKKLAGLAGREMLLSKDQYFIARNESLIGYEASNHYYYTPLDLVEKMLNCEYIIRELS